MIVFQKSHCMNLQNEFIGEKIDIQVSVRISMRRSVEKPGDTDTDPSVRASVHP